MTMKLEPFYDELMSDVLRESDVAGNYAAEVFFEKACEHIVADGGLITADRVFFYNGRGIQIDGYGGDPREDDNVLKLIVLDYQQEDGIGRLNTENLETSFNRASNFLKASIDPSFAEKLEQTDPSFGLAQLISSTWKSVVGVQLFLVSNRRYTGRLDQLKSENVEGRTVTRTLWDLDRLHSYAVSGREREPLSIDLESEFGGCLPVLAATQSSEGYKGYLTMIPGETLAAIYERWGNRLLEQNVRVFLQGRGKVNRGIRQTLEEVPDLFFAYNNGITTTAEGIEVIERDGSMYLRGIQNWQIVNGAQTTASIFAASKNPRVDLSDVFVQVKLVEVEPAKAADLVPNISRYANTQNSVSSADFFSNHPFHVRIEGFSRRIQTPVTGGKIHSTKWFYERARGQYLDLSSHASDAEKRINEAEYPRDQKFNKEELAMYRQLWDGKPDLVSKGGQKNFANFAEAIAKEWEKDERQFSEEYFRETIAKAIIFKECDRLVKNQEWYGGYKRNIVAYTIAKIAYDIEGMGKVFLFDAVWREQGISSELRDILSSTAKVINEMLHNPPSRFQNITEWAKQQTLWDQVRGTVIEWPDSLHYMLISKGEQQTITKKAKKDQSLLTGIEIQTRVSKAGPEFWNTVALWAVDRNLLLDSEQNIMRMLSQGELPSEKQCILIWGTLERLQSNEGMQHKIPS